jgi:hypothetical protein
MSVSDRSLDLTGLIDDDDDDQNIYIYVKLSILVLNKLPIASYGRFLASLYDPSTSVLMCVRRCQAILGIV